MALVTRGRTWLLMWVALALHGGVAAAQISPGPLAQAHQELEGPLKCKSCHGGGKESMSAQCIACHKDIGWLLQQDRGLHAAELETPCSQCHPDHAGREFALISWPEGNPVRFDHRRTGWPLEGSHVNAKCEDCHKPAFATGPAKRLSKRRTPGTGWIGLERTCASCHEDAHRGALDQTCTTCHDLDAWKPAPKFDHARTDYPLTGAHLKVTCSKCHLDTRQNLKTDSKGQPIPLYKPLPHQQCSACHNDPHVGKLGRACADCHTTQSFTTINRASFDHDRTRYPLAGRHTQVKCEQCHDFNSITRKNPPFATCGACHQDPHAGQATLAGKAVDCAECHRVQGFAPSTYTAAQHRLARFPLEGKHQTVTCGACHLKNPPNISAAKLGSARVLMRPVYEECTSCHANVHGGQLAGRADNGACEACHRVAGWKPSSFTSAMHAKLRVALDGRHAEIACSACHGPNRKGLPPLPDPAVLGKAGVALTLKETECVACHVDPHGGRYSAGGQRPLPEGCLACHDTRGFHPSTMDAVVHAQYGFKLEGAHGAVPCVACHQDLKQSAPLTSSLVGGRRQAVTINFTIKQTGCPSCHNTPHGDQFAHRADQGACESCHGVERFKPATRFDHDRDASFALKGGHAKVPCDRCHVPDPKGKIRVTYAPLSSKCESCHGDRVPSQGGKS